MGRFTKPITIKCPQCQGSGVISTGVRAANEIAPRNHKATNEERDLRLPELTGTKDQCTEAKRIRKKFLSLAESLYNSDNYESFLKLVRYEPHALFWINSRNENIAKIVFKILARNPTASELIDISEENK